MPDNYLVSSDTNQLTQTKKYFPALTGLRAVSALLVFYFHGSAHINTDWLPFLDKWKIRLLQQGNFGVGIFFVLSGFLIATRYGNGVELTGPWFRRYLQNRFARIYPVYFLLTILTFGVMIIRPQYDWDEWTPLFRFSDKVVAVVLNLTLTRAYFQKMVFLGVVTAWTLTVEETFYLCAPFLLVRLKRNPAGFLIYPVLLLTIGTLLVAFCARFLPDYGLMASMDFMLTYTFFGRCVEFFVGIGLAFWLARHNGPLRVGGLTLLGVAGIVVCMLAHAATQHLPAQNQTLMLYAGILVKNFLLPFPVALLLLGLIKEYTWLQRVLKTKVFDLLGKSSYVFYLIHIGVIDTYFYEHVTDNLLVRLLVATILSIGLYKWIEKPLHQRLRASSLSRDKPKMSVEKDLSTVYQ